MDDMRVCHRCNKFLRDNEIHEVFDCVFYLRSRVRILENEVSKKQKLIEIMDSITDNIDAALDIISKK